MSDASKLWDPSDLPKAKDWWAQVCSTHNISAVGDATFIVWAWKRCSLVFGTPANTDVVLLIHQAYLIGCLSTAQSLREPHEE